MLSELIRLAEEQNSEQRVFLKDRGVLAFYKKKADPQFWERHWGNVSPASILNCITDEVFIPRVKKYLPVGSSVLEGGCGAANLVNALVSQGYKGVGVDFAKSTIEQVNRIAPHLDVRVGDVCGLPFGPGEFHGYVSAGVIEHFWDGYNAIILEMNRVLKLGGYLFISFPFMSPIRQFKAALGAYESTSVADAARYKDNFYQFALNWQDVLRDLQAAGFALQQLDYCDGIKGFKDEASWFKPFLQKIYDGLIYQDERGELDALFRQIAGHIAVMVLQKTKDL